MVSRVLDDREVGAPSSGRQPACDAGLVRPATEQQAQADAGRADHQSELVSRGLGLVRGIRIALAIEAAAGLCLYGLWCLWHFLR